MIFPQEIPKPLLLMGNGISLLMETVTGSMKKNLNLAGLMNGAPKAPILPTTGLMKPM